MNQPWHRSEPRAVRPFFEAQAAEEALGQSTIRLYREGDALLDTDYSLDDVDFERLEPAVLPVLVNPGKWMPAGYELDDFKLVLIARQPFLKTAIVVAEQSLSPPLPSEWKLGSDILTKLNGGRNTQITLALCLAQDKPFKPGAPFTMGHWLARKVFNLKCRVSPTLFDVRTRTDEEWVAAGYPAKTFLLVDYAGGIDTEIEEGTSIATVHIHAESYNRMVNAPLGDSLQPLLAAQIISEILLSSLKDWEALEAAPPGSPLATLLKQFGTLKPLPLQDLRNMVKKPGLLKAELQHRLNVVRALR